MEKSSTRSEKAMVKLRKLKCDLIWCFREMEKHNLGFPSVDRALSDLAYKKEIDNIDRCKKFQKQVYEKIMACYDLLAPYDGKPIFAIPQVVLDRAVKLLQEAETAGKEWFCLSGIKEKRQ